MQFDLFHSIGRVDNIQPQRDDVAVLSDFFDQIQLAEQLGFDTIWVAESHFSSEVQKSHQDPVIPHYQGEVGLNSDSMQLFHAIVQRTQKINFGTAIHNIVGGNGGPIASADRVRFMAFLNALSPKPRTLSIGVASGRFPYINKPFGIVPRSDIERSLWSEVKGYIFLEALEIFLRLSLGETLSSADLRSYQLSNGQPYMRRWEFESLSLVPHLDAPQDRSYLRFVIGSHDPRARELALSLTDVDVFNLSFTPPEQLEQMHEQLAELCRQLGRSPWHRKRMPRTVLVFIDQHEKQAWQRAHFCFDTYIEAMRGTVKLPPKEALMERALIGTPQQIIDQLSMDHDKGFHPDDRLMLWFEFNQSDNGKIKDQMSLFAEKVMPEFVKGTAIV